MQKVVNFTIRISPEERQIIDLLGSIMERSGSDVCRIAIRRLAAQEMNKLSPERKEIKDAAPIIRS